MKKIFLLCSFLAALIIVGCLAKPSVNYDYGLVLDPEWRMQDKALLAGADIADDDAIIVEDVSAGNITKHTTMTSIANYLYADNVTSDLQVQLDARCLESVLGTSIDTGLLLDGTALKTSAILQKYHGVDPSTDVLAMLGSANDTALRTEIGLGSAATRSAEDSMTDGSNLPDGAAIIAYGVAQGWGAGGGAPTDATYITQTPDGTLSAEQAISLLSNGLLKHASGVFAMAVAGTDYLVPAGSGAALTGIPLDSDFGSNGLMERTGAGAYGVATAGTDYLAPAGSGAALTSIPLDSDFGSNGIMTRTGAGTYAVITQGTAASRDAEDTLTDGSNLPDGAAIKTYGDANWISSGFDNTVTVAKSGGDYTTVTAALASITDANATNEYVVKIYPGIYSETVTGKDYVAFHGSGNRAVIEITSATGPVYTYPDYGGCLKDLTLSLTPTTDNQQLLLVPGTRAGVCGTRNCKFNITSSTNDIVATMLDVNGTANMNYYDSSFNYTMTGTAVGAKNHDIINIHGTAGVNTYTSNMVVSVGDVDDNVTLFDSDTATASGVYFGNVSIVGEATNAAYSGDFKGIDLQGTAKRLDIWGSYINISGLAGTGNAFYVDSPSGGSLLYSSANIIRVTGFTNNYAGYADTSDNVTFASDTLIAADDTHGAGVFRYHGVNVNDEFHVSEDMHAKYLEFPNNANSYLGADKTYTDYFAIANDYTNFWLGYSADQNIWMNYGKNADIKIGAGTGGDCDLIIHEGDANKTTLNQNGIDFKVQVGVTNGSVDLVPNGSGVVKVGGTQIGLSDLGSKPITGLSATNWRVFYSADGGIPVELALGADGTYLRSNGASAAPTFATPSGSGDVTGPATHSADYVPQWNATPNSKTLVEGFAITTAGKAILDDADASAQRTTLGLAIGTNVQAWDADLDDLADGTLSGSKVQSNSSTSAGVVASGSGQVSLVWKTDASGIPAWRADATGAGGSAITFDIGDDGGNDSVDLNEIATTGDTNNIVTLNAADKMLVDMGQNWPTADVANAGDNATSFFSAGELIDARVSDTLTASLFVGSGSTTNAIDLATAEVAGTLPDGNIDAAIARDSELIGGSWASPGAAIGTGTPVAITASTFTGSGAALTGLQAPDIADGTVTDVEFQYINSLSSNAQDQLNGKQATVTEGSLADSVIVTADIKDSEILEADLNVSNSPTDNYLLSYNLAGTNFTWVAAAGGGDLKADGSVPLTANWDIGAYTITGLRFVSDQATGTAPLTVASTTIVTNLNADTVDGESASAIVTAARVGGVSANLDPSDASIEWEDAVDLGADGSLSADSVADNEINYTTWNPVLPSASPAAPTVDGGIEVDFTDGTVVVQHGSAHAELGAATDVVVGKLIESFTATLAFPDLLQAEIDQWPLKAIEASEFPHGIVITDIYLKTSASSTYAINIENWDTPTTINASNPTIDAITTSTSTEAHEDTITYSTIAAGQIIMLDLPTTDIGWAEIQVEYYEGVQ